MADLISLRLFRNKTGIFFPPALKEDIETTELFLQKHDLGPIPEDYRTLLEINDGLSCGGLELFGTATHPRPEKGYNFPNLQRVNSTYLKYDFFRKKMVFGRLSEAILFYDQKLRSYTLADRINLRSRLEVKDLNALLSALESFC